MSKEEINCLTCKYSDLTNYEMPCDKCITDGLENCGEFTQWKSKISPCKSCEARSLGCHDHCEKTTEQADVEHGGKIEKQRRNLQRLQIQTILHGAVERDTMQGV